jgi:hypothetical protein
MPVTARRLAVFIAAALWAVSAWCQGSNREPHLGYLYPAGGQQGTTIRINIGGQNLRGTNGVYISGGGVRARVVEYMRPLNPKDLGEIAGYLRALVKQRLSGGPAPAIPARQKPNKGAAQPGELPTLPDHPLLRDLDKKTIPELLELRDKLFNLKKTPNPAIADTVVIDVTLDPKADAGDRELRLTGPNGLTNPMVFQVGTLPEVREKEPNDPGPTVTSAQIPPRIGDRPGLMQMLNNRPPLKVLDLPAVLNGQIEPGDVDRFRFRARQGQQLVFQAQARHLMPYLADAVPGWFQATLAVFDAKGKEVAYDDDYRFDPDPVLLYKVPADGEYELEIHDSIYRGRDDFVYRVTVGEQPFITQVFPLGSQAGVATTATVSGWNLTATKLPLDTRPDGYPVRLIGLRQGQYVSNWVSYAVGDLPEMDEIEPNNTIATAQAVAMPRIINGRISKPGDVDVYRIEGRAGDEVVAEVQARRLGSPLDSLVRLTGASGKVVAWNDDHEDKGAGLCTHQADSYMTAKLPVAGTYYVHVSDTQGHGGDEYAYRLRIGAPHPSFTLRVTPSSVCVPVGRSATVDVFALRQDGFAGDIDLKLRNPAAGFSLQGGRIPAGRDHVRLTLTAVRKYDQPVAVQIEGSAQVGGRTLTCLALPAEDMMQAFAYRHLVPSGEFLAQVTGLGRFAPTIQIAGAGPVKIPAGGTALVNVASSMPRVVQAFKLDLNDPPSGITLEQVTPTANGLSFLLKADAKSSQVGYADNLIVEASVEMENQRTPKGGAKAKRRISVGVLPAISFEVVKG